MVGWLYLSRPSVLSGSVRIYHSFADVSKNVSKKPTQNIRYAVILYWPILLFLLYDHLQSLVEPYLVNFTVLAWCSFVPYLRFSQTSPLLVNHNLNDRSRLPIHLLHCFLALRKYMSLEILLAVITFNPFLLRVVQ